MILQDTIAAISSAGGGGARMIVRGSGGGGWGVSFPRFGFFENTNPPHPNPLPAYRERGQGASRVRLSFAGMTVPAWVYWFVGPRSYTGEDLAEFHIPGNPLLARMLL